MRNLFNAFILIALFTTCAQADVFKQTDGVYMTSYIKDVAGDSFINVSFSLPTADLSIVDINIKTPHSALSVGGLTTQVTIVGNAGLKYNLTKANPIHAQNLQYRTYEVGWNDIDVHMISA